ncbi:MAG TPA: hypothetical protein DIT04_09495 [Dysgonomonas sp.]|nr:hypothetical protein [Dysgonomonas sp.]
MARLKNKNIGDTMKEKDLHEKFVDYLHSLYPSKKELINILEDILKIERESISRRLKGQVFFTANEIGKIAEKLNISLNYIMDNNNDSIFLPLNLAIPQAIESVDDYFKQFYYDLDLLSEMKKISPLQLGYVFDIFPIEFYLPYKNLCKYMYFKSMTLFVRTKFFDKFSSWQLPEYINKYHNVLIECLNKAESIFYVWNNTLIWNFIKDLNLSYKLRLIDNEDVQLIKKDIHDLLEEIVRKSKTVTKNTEIKTRSIDLYISSININFSASYLHSSTQSLVQYRSPTLYSKIYRNTKEFYTVYNWMNSMKKLSTLISNSSIVDRNLFFEEQHKIVDNMLLGTI